MILEALISGRMQSHASTAESVAKVRAQLGHEQFDRVYAQGSTLNLEEAIDVIWRARSRMAPR